MMVMDAKYTLPNISHSAVRRVEGKGGGAAQRYVVWSQPHQVLQNRRLMKLN